MRSMQVDEIDAGQLNLVPNCGEWPPFPITFGTTYRVPNAKYAKFNGVAAKVRNC